MSALIRVLDRSLPFGRPLALVAVIVGLFFVAWIVSRVASRLATILVDRSERRRHASGVAFDTATMTSLRQRETAIGLVTTSIRYVVYAIAIVLSIVALSGAQRLQTIVGASFLAVLIGFAVQRFLMDVVAGLLMFFEGWFRIGDTVAIDSLHAQGVVEAVSLRSLKIRTVKGEIVYVPNSQVVALRVIPRGYREIEVEFFASDLQRGEELVREVARIVPTGPTRFIRRPELTETEKLDDGLFRITARCAVAVGREWLADDLLPALIKERAAEPLLVHDPIVMFVDEQAVRSFRRVTATLPPQEGWPVPAGVKPTPPPS